MTAIVAILVYLAFGLCWGLYVKRDALLGWDRAPEPLFWVFAGLLGVPVFITACLFWLFDAITGRR